MLKCVYTSYFLLLLSWAKFYLQNIFMWKVVLLDADNTLFPTSRALERGGLSTLALKKLFTIVPESIISKFPISDLLGQAISHGQNDSASLDALKVILSHVEDLSITRALVEQYVDQLCNEDSQTVESK